MIPQTNRPTNRFDPHTGSTHTQVQRTHPQHFGEPGWQHQGPARSLHRLLSNAARAPSRRNRLPADPPLRETHAASAPCEVLKAPPPTGAALTGMPGCVAGAHEGPTHLRLARVPGSAALGRVGGLAVRPRPDDLPEGAAQGEAAHADPI